MNISKKQLTEIIRRESQKIRVIQEKVNIKDGEEYFDVTIDYPAADYSIPLDKEISKIVKAIGGNGIDETGSGMGFGRRDIGYVTKDQTIANKIKTKLNGKSISGVTVKVKIYKAVW